MSHIFRLTSWRAKLAAIETRAASKEFGIRASATGGGGSENDAAVAGGSGGGGAKA